MTRHAVRTVLLAVPVLGTTLALAQARLPAPDRAPPGPAAAPNPTPARAADEVAPPESARECLDRLEGVLGKFEAKNARQFRIAFDGEKVTVPDPARPPVVVASKGTMVYGTPFPLAGAVAFDTAEDLRRTVYDAPAGGERTVSRRQQRHYTLRYALRPTQSGGWEFDATLLTHSIPHLVGKPMLAGTVRWFADGFELAGVGVDDMYGPNGTLVRVGTYSTVRFRREGADLVVTDRWQNYSLARGPGGAELPVPDFSRPLGEPTVYLTGRASRD